MIGLLLEAIFSVVGEILFQLFVDLMFELGLESIGASIRDRREANPVLAGIGFIMVGAIAGLVVSWLLPRRLVPTVNLNGLSILVAAAGTGFVMMQYGNWRERRDGRPTYLATFWGGALFAASMALARWWSVGR